MVNYCLPKGMLMRNILMHITFDGTRYHGWQVQKNAYTVQEAVQDSIEKILKERPDVTGCSRTDSGVHANEYACNFRTALNVPCENLVKAFNAVLPEDISCLRCADVDDDFHARYSAKGKEYIYRIYTNEIRNPFYNGYALHYPHPLNIEKMNAAANYFVGTHDFKAFCAAGSSVKDTVRTVRCSDVYQDGDFTCFRVSANGFLYNMVRIMTGTLLYVSQGKLSPADIDLILENKNRVTAGPTAPPHGLYLNRIFYHD